MRFKRAIQRYGRTPEPETPYQRAGQLWDERIGSARVQARNWRFIAFGNIALVCGLSGALIWQSLQSRVVPYVVEVDNLGQAKALSAVDANYTPSDAQMAWFLRRFIANIRSRSLDPVLMRENWLAAYDFVSPRGAAFLSEYARAANPFAEIGELTVSVQITSVVRASDTSFQVKWTENAYERGALAGTSRWTAILTIRVKPPTKAETLRKNPLGLYVDAIDWSRELEAATPETPLTPRAGTPASPAIDQSVLPSPQPAPGAHPPLGSPLDARPAALAPIQPENRP